MSTAVDRGPCESAAATRQQARVRIESLASLYIVLYEAIPQLPWVNAKVASAECALDDDLPNACGAEHQLRVGVAEKILSFR